MRVVYYANFFIWFESGRVELFRSRGVVYRDIEEMGIFMPVVEARASYKAPARFDDELLVKTRIKEMGNTSVTFENEVYRLPEMELLCRGVLAEPGASASVRSRAATGWASSRSSASSNAWIMRQRGQRPFGESGR